MKYYNFLSIFFGVSIICCYSFCMNPPKRLPQQISKQLITTHNVEKQEKELLNNIIEYYPEWAYINDPDQKKLNLINFAVYTPQYFQDSIKVLRTFKSGETTDYGNTLKQQSLLYITHVAMNNELWPTIEDKLIHINNCFQEYTLSYLQETWERYKPTMVISTIPAEIEELPYEKGTVEEIPSEEEEAEEKVIEEQPLSQTKQERQTNISPRQYEKKTNIKPASSREPKKQPNIIYRAINFMWSGISSLFKWMVSWFK